MKKILNLIKNNKKRLTYIRETSQSRTYYVTSNNNRQNFIDNAKKVTSLSIYFVNNKGLNCYERNYFRSQNI